MLLITRRVGEKIMVGDDVVVHVMEIVGNTVRIGIQAPRSTPVYREEIWHAVREENRAAADAAVRASLALAGASRIEAAPAAFVPPMRVRSWPWTSPRPPATSRSPTSPSLSLAIASPLDSPASAAQAAPPRRQDPCWAAVAPPPARPCSSSATRSKRPAPGAQRDAPPRRPDTVTRRRRFRTTTRRSGCQHRDRRARAARLREPAIDEAAEEAAAAAEAANIGGAVSDYAGPEGEIADESEAPAGRGRREASPRGGAGRGRTA